MREGGRVAEDGDGLLVRGNEGSDIDEPGEARKKKKGEGQYGSQQGRGRKRRRLDDALQSRNGLQVIKLEDDSLRSISVRDVVPARIRNAGEIGELGSEGIDISLQDQKKETRQDFGFARLERSRERTQKFLKVRSVISVDWFLTSLGAPNC